MKYLVIGTGISGATFSRIMAESGFDVEVWERRLHIGGNIYDYKDEYGVLVHKYGPHIFHTSNSKVWEFINKFEDWKPFKLVCGAEWDGKYTPTAFNFKTIDTFYPPQKAYELKKKLIDAYPGRLSATVVEVLQNEDPDIRAYGEFLFENDYAPYTAKQWGVKPEEIDVSILRRVPLRFSYEESYFSDKYEAMPAHSYTQFISNMLDHPNITIRLGIDALEYTSFGENIISLKDENNVKVVYTGAVDELFNYKYEKLPYRSLRFEWKHEDIDSLQKAPVVAYPKAEGYTRITEYKKLPVQEISGTTYAIEYPLPYVSEETNEPFYPVLTEKSHNQYIQYYNLAQKYSNLILCGRLADFKYYNMDQAIIAAMNIAESELMKQL